MSVQLETFNPAVNRSFRLMVNPKLNDVFYWHLHEEYELVYVKGINGNRIVGSHNSRFEDCDLVFIGSNIPHLNFDYGASGSYDIIVLHFRREMIEMIESNFPELEGIDQLLKKSMHGLTFSRSVIDAVGNYMMQLDSYSKFDQFIHILSILKILANDSGSQLLHRDVYVNKGRIVSQGRLKKVYDFVHINYHRKVFLKELAELCTLSEEAFCRYFKKETGITFIEFLNQYRISQAKRLLLMNKNISEVCFESGFESLSYFNRRFKKATGINPSRYKANIKKQLSER